MIIKNRLELQGYLCCYD